MLVIYQHKNILNKIISIELEQTLELAIKLRNIYLLQIYQPKLRFTR